MLKTPEELQMSRSGWDRLAGVVRSPLLDMSYAEAFIAGYGETAARIVIYEEGGSIRAIAPLREVRRSGTTALEYLDQPTFEVHSGFLHDGPEAAAKLCEGLVQLGYPLVLVRVPSKCPEVAAFHELAARHKCFVSVRPAPATARVRFEGGPIEKRMRSSSLSRLRQMRRKAQQLGEVEFDLSWPTPEQTPDLVRAFVEVESSGWKGRSGSGLQQNAPMRAFFTGLCLRAAERGELHIGIMRIGGRPAAARLATDRYGYLWDHKIGYDETFSAVSPGVLLTHETLLRTQDMGRDGLVFLGNHEEWQDRWLPEITETCTIRVIPLSLRGLVAAFGEGARAVRRRLVSSP